MTEEHKIQNDIRIALSKICVIFRINVGTGWTKDGRYFNTGVPRGFSDLFGVRKSDGKAVFIEVKTKQGVPSKEQLQFISEMKKAGAIAGIARSVQGAIDIVKKG